MSFVPRSSPTVELERDLRLLGSTSWDFMGPAAYLFLNTSLLTSQRQLEKNLPEISQAPNEGGYAVTDIKEPPVMKGIFRKQGRQCNPGTPAPPALQKRLKSCSGL